jgi:Bifunctional DNA primase/polymerase, N-terminal/Primase C terminal 2 (PriCT-2)/Family of unknown function (DUF5906)
MFMNAPPRPLGEIQAANSAVALQLAEARISIFPARVVWDGRSGKWQKQPLVKRWQKAATTDRTQIRAWFERFPDAVPGIELGRAKLIVIDADRHGGPDGVAALDALAKEHGGLPNCPVTSTAGGGIHRIFRQPDGKTFGNRRGALPAGIDVRGVGGWIVAPGSVRPDGAMWSAAEGTPPLAEAYQAGTIPIVPDWITGLIQGKSSNSSTDGTGESPSSSPPNWSEAEETRIDSALAYIPADDRDNNWLPVGMALHWTRWGERARALWDKWSKTSTKYDPVEQDKAWNSFGRPDYKGPVVTLGTLFHLAKEHGWEESPISEIDELNARHFVIRSIGGKCLVGEMVRNPMGSGQMLSLQRVNDFKTWYSNRKITVRDNKGKKKTKNLGAFWIEHPKRRQYEGVDLLPDAPTVLPNGYLNLWRGFGVDPTQGQWPLVFGHICEVLANGDRKAAQYILRWIAWSVQHPGMRAEVALVFRGNKGSGKGVFIGAVVRIFGEHALHIFQQSHLTGKFNNHLRSCLFLFADEAFWAGDKKGESVLKGLITEPSLMIEQKGVDAIQWPNRLHVIMAANAAWVVPASHDERRFAVFDVSDKYAKGTAQEEVRASYFEALHRELENGGLEAMLYDLLHFDLGNWHPRQVYETEELRRQKEQSMSLIEQWFDELLQDGKMPGYGSLSGKPNCATTQSLMADAQSRVPRLRDYLTEKAMGDFLRKRECLPDRTNQARGWQFPPLGEMRAKWARRYGGRTWDAPELQDWQTAMSPAFRRAAHDGS